MKIEKFSYDNQIVKMFLYATIVFGIVGMLVGLTAALQIFIPSLNGGIPWITFGRIRPLTPTPSFSHLLEMDFLPVYITRCSDC